MEKDIIAVVIVGLIIVALVFYYIAVTLKGNVKVVLSKADFRFGETLTGVIKVEARKVVRCNSLYIKLVGNEIVKGKNAKGENTKRSRVIYKNETEMHGALDYVAGTKHSIPFDMDLPDAFGLAQVEKPRQFISNTLRNEYRYYEWKISVHVDAEGIDLTDRCRILIS